MVLIVPYSAKLLHRKVLTAAMRAKMSFFVATDTGEIVNRFSQDMTLVVYPPFHLAFRSLSVLNKPA